MPPQTTAQPEKPGTIREDKDGKRWIMGPETNPKWIRYTKAQEFVDAIKKGSLPKVSRLVETEGMNPNNMINKFVTPLILATSYGHTQLIKYLLKAGANPGHKTGSGMTVLFHAIDGRTYNEDYVDPPRPECVKLLLKDPRTDVNAVWDTGRGSQISVLSWAVLKADSSAFRPDNFEKRLEVVELLLSHKDLDKAERLKVHTQVAAMKHNAELKKLFEVTKPWWSLY